MSHEIGLPHTYNMGRTKYLVISFAGGSLRYHLFCAANIKLYFNPAKFIPFFLSAAMLAGMPALLSSRSPHFRLE